MFLDATVGNAYGLDKVYSFTDILYRLKKVLLFQSAPKISGATWFLATLFFVEVIYVIIDYICTKVAKEHRPMAVNMIMLLIYVTNVCFIQNGMTDNSGYRMHIVFLSIFLFHIGQKIKNYETLYKEPVPVLTVFLALSIIYILKMQNIGAIKYARGEIVGGVELFIWSMAGWFLVYGISQIISEGKSFIAECFVYIGKHTLPILLLHQFSFKIVTYVQIIIYKEPTYMLGAFPVLYTDGAWWLIYSMVGIGVPLILCVWGKKFVAQIRKIVQ